MISKKYQNGKLEIRKDVAHPYYYFVRASVVRIDKGHRRTKAAREEHQLRGLIRRVLVVAPKGLVSQWVTEMRTHFGGEFRLMLPTDFPAFRRVAAQENVRKTLDQVVVPLDAVKPIDNRKGWPKEQVAEHNCESL